jgi:flavin reductase (DIM6/NTAB) family NADH-FMN oxidoreductase RutF
VTVKLDPAVLSPADVYRLMIGIITPRPIAWVSTISPQGVTNLAPFSFFNGVGANPPAIVFCPVNRKDGSKKDTVLNIEASGELVVNVVPYAAREAMNATSEELPHEVSEFERCGVASLPSERVKPPRVQQSPVALECVRHQIVHVGEGPLAANVIIARIVLMHVADELLDDKGRIAPRALDTIGRLGGSGYARTTDLFFMPRPGMKSE